jgi:hypothetical protein
MPKQACAQEAIETLVHECERYLGLADSGRAGVVLTFDKDGLEVPRDSVAHVVRINANGTLTYRGYTGDPRDVLYCPDMSIRDFLRAITRDRLSLAARDGSSSSEEQKQAVNALKAGQTDLMHALVSTTSRVEAALGARLDQFLESASVADVEKILK